MTIGKLELAQWLIDNLVKPAMGADYYAPPSWDPLTNSDDARRVACFMEQQGWKFKLQMKSTLSWEATFSKWDDKGSKGARGRCYGGLEESICYAAYFAILSMRAVEAVQP